MAVSDLGAEIADCWLFPRLIAAFKTLSKSVFPVVISVNLASFLIFALVSKTPSVIATEVNCAFTVFTASTCLSKLSYFPLATLYSFVFFNFSNAAFNLSTLPKLLFFKANLFASVKNES